MKVTLDDIEAVLNQLSSAITYVKQARHVARKVYGNEDEISVNMKYAYADILKASKLIEGTDKT